MSDLEVIAQGINLLWVLIATFLIFFMHAGFAMLEAGQVRSKNVANQLTKNLLTWSVGVMTFFLLGAALSSIVGHLTGATGAWSVVGEFAAILAPTDVNTWVDWLFGAVFAMTAATIVSGAVAGRCKLRTYVGYTILLAGVFYPVVVGFTWAGGFLSSLGFHDFAGGMIVHGMGGLAGLTAAWIIGPRLGRFEEDGTANVIPGHSVTFAALGTLILAFGWYGFNVGTAATVFSVENGTISLAAFETVGRVALVTTLGMGAGTLGAGAVSLIRTGKVDTLYVANGLLAGLVGITAIADDIVWPGAIIVGLLAGAQLPFVFEFVEKRLQIDDVCAVFPVHGSAGILGTLVYPFVAVGTWQSFSLGTVLSGLAVQATGIAVIGLWIVGATVVVFGGARKLGQARVTPHHEKEGLDASEHGVETYPEFGHEGTHGVVPESLRTDGGRPNGGKIKLVTAIVRPDKLGDVKRGLAEVGAPSLTVTNVSGRGNQPAKLGQWRGEEYVVDLHQKVKVECVVADIPAEEVAEAIRDAATTGEPGDGKVFILPVEDAYQVRTGKQGQDAV